MFETQARNKIKVVDFGISGLCTANEAEKNDAATLKYMTPEMASGGSVANPAMDVWAIGIMIYCMLFNKMPFTGGTREEIKAKIQNKEPVLPAKKPVTEPCKVFLQSCLVKNPAERITIEQMLDHKWFTISDDRLEDLCEEAKEAKPVL